MKPPASVSLRVLVLLLVALLPRLQGQEDHPTIQFSVFGETGRNWSGIFYSPDGERFEEIRFTRYTRSVPYDYRGPSPLVVYRRSLDPEGNFIHTPVARAALPPAASPVLLFFLNEPGSTTSGPDAPFRLMAMDDSHVALPRNHVVFFNATGVQLLGAFGEEEITLNPGQSRPLDLRARFREEVPVGFVVRRGDTFERVLVNRLRFSEGLRTIIVLLPPRRADTFRIQAIRLVDEPGR